MTLEQALREAMAHDTASLRAAPDLADRVVRRAARRSGRRTLSVVMAVAVIAAFTGYFLTRTPDRPVAAEVDGVEVRYLPPGLGAPTRHGTALTWSSGDNEVTVTVQRDTTVRLESLPGRPDRIRGRAARTNPSGTDLAWLERPRFLLRVTVGAAQKAALRRIAEGLYPQDAGPGVFAGMRVTYIPDGLYRETSHDGPVEEQPSLDCVWTGDGKYVQLTIGSDDMLPPGRSRRLPSRYGRQVTLTVSYNLAGELDRIAAGIEPAESYEGITVGYVPDGLTTDERLVGGLGGLGKTWTDGHGRQLRIEVVRGDRAATLSALTHLDWPTDEVLTGLTPATVHGKPAYRGRAEDTRVVLWLERPGFGVVVSYPEPLEKDVRRILDGITADPEPSSQGAQVDGVRVTTALPRTGTSRASGRDWTAVTGTWSRAGSVLRVEVARGAGSRQRVEQVPAVTTALSVGDRVRSSGDGWKREVWRASEYVTVVVTATDGLDAVMAALAGQFPPVPPVFGSDPAGIEGTTCDGVPPPVGRRLSGRLAVRGLRVEVQRKLTQGAPLTHLDGVNTRRLYGYAWSAGTSRLEAGVVCDVPAGGLDAVVRGADPAVLGGRPALTWTRGGTRYAMWLQRPGVAVFYGRTPDLRDVGPPQAR